MEVAELINVIDKQLERLREMFIQEGDLTSGEYSALARPLHDALLALAQGKKAGPLPDLSKMGVNTVPC